jgi:enamine deaminase RidA (YjgF/YER057c/UK114 family)
VEVVDGDIRQLIISGTASIDIDGNSLHQGSISLQIDHTMNVISAILQSRQMNWDNICRAVVYFKNPAEQKFYDKYRIEKGIPDFPSLAVRADICRDELLFEIEVDAVQTMD